jgi:hypothetical protein
MENHMATPDPLQTTHCARVAGLAFTPAEWRHILEDPAFLSDEDNSYAAPRRLMGVPVTIVPDHEVAAWT